MSWAQEVVGYGLWTHSLNSKHCWVICLVLEADRLWWGRGPISAPMGCDTDWSATCLCVLVECVWVCSLCHAYFIKVLSLSFVLTWDDWILLCSTAHHIAGSWMCVCLWAVLNMKDNAQTIVPCDTGGGQLTVSRGTAQDTVSHWLWTDGSAYCSCDYSVLIEGLHGTLQAGKIPQCCLRIIPCYYD